MRANQRMSGARCGLSILGLAFLAAAALAAKEPSAASASYAGEAVVRSLSDHRVVVALDETGSGVASHLFYVETREPIEALSLRSASAQVESSESGLTVTLPREHRMLLFDLFSERRRPDVRRAAPAGAEERAAAGITPDEGFELTRIDRVASLAQYSGGRAGLSLDALEAGDSGGLLQSLSGNVVDFPPPTEEGGDGGGEPCPKSCAVTCGDSVHCAASCPSGCAICSCLFGAACHC